MRKFIKAVLLILITSLFAGCSVIEPRIQMVRDSGISGLYLALGSLLILLLLIVLIIAVYYAERRWQILQLIRPSRYLSKIPGMREATVLKRGADTTLQQGQRAKRYLPGYESELSSGTLKPGQAVRPSQASIGGEKANQRKNQKGFAALLPAPMRKWWNQRKKKSNQTDDDTMVAEPADPQPTQPTQAAQAAQPTQADAERRRVPIDGRLGDVTAVSPQTQPQPTAATIAPLPVTTTIAPTTAEIPHPIAPQVGRQPLSNEFILSLNDIADENPPDLIGKRLDRYQIDAQLAHGRLGTLYQGFDLKLGRQVAVKLIRPPFIQTAEQQSQLLKSIQAIANIEHPGIAEIHDFELEQGHLLLVSEFIQGPTIDAYTNHMKSQAWQISLAHTLEQMAQVADALELAHSKGIVHGNLKPGHILLETPEKNGAYSEADNPPETQAKVVDFGLSQLHLAAAEMAPSLLPYLSPEQLAERPFDGRSDVFACGAILYELVTGVAPFAANDLTHDGDPPTLPSQHRPTLPVELEQLIMQALAADPAARYQTAGTMAKVLHELADRLSPTQAQENQARKTAKTGSLQIHITSSGESPRIIQLNKTVLHMGTSPDCDIYLPSKSVDPFHAKIQRSQLGWQISDLGSESGTYVESSRLLAKVPEEWGLDESVAIGPYTLVRQEAKTHDNTDTGVDGTGVDGIITDGAGADDLGVGANGTAIDNTLGIGSNDSRVALRISPYQVEVMPGMQINIQVQLRNNGIHVDHFHIGIEGLAANWLTISDNNVQLMPGDEHVVVLAIAPPATYHSAAGDYPFTVTAVPRSAPTEANRIKGNLLVLPFEQISSEMTPELLHNKGVCQLTVSNHGNADTSLTFIGQDHVGELDFKLLPTPILLPPGMMETLDVELAARRPFVGTRRNYPFIVTVKTGGGAEEANNGQVDVRPYIPAWLASIAGLLFVFLCLAGMGYASYRQGQQQLAQTSAIATQAALNAIPEPTEPAPIPTMAPTAVPLPGSCVDIAASSADATDDEYTLYIGRDETKSVTVYCHTMNSNPREFITLQVTGQQSNYASTSYPGHDLLTHYTRVRINLQTLTIDTTDRTFATTSGTIPIYSQTESTDFGTATGCNEGGSGSALGQANINLTGTAFSLSNDVAFVIEGQDLEGDNILVSAEGQIADLSASGRCGWVQAQDGIQLVYLGASDDVALND